MRYVPIKDRFEEKIFYSPDGCWYWLGHIDSCGYGRINIKRIATLTHRVSHELYKGEIGNMCVCHTCDNPACVNHDHLFLGTHQDNMDDRTAKKRHSYYKGQDHPSAKITDSDVNRMRLLRKMGLKNSLIAKCMNISLRTVRGITSHKKWVHLPAPSLPWLRS